MNCTIPMTPEIWEQIVARLDRSHPWPVALVEFDLDVWAAKVRDGKVPKRPGRPTLAARWGWSAPRTRKMLERHRVDKEFDAQPGAKLIADWMGDAGKVTH